MSKTKKIGKDGYELLNDQRGKVISALRSVSLLIGDIQKQTVRLSKNTYGVLGLGMKDEAKSLIKLANELKQGIFKVLVLGEFKTGKSTMLNAMLGQKFLPVKTTPTTGIITVLVNGTNQDVAIYRIGQRQPEIVNLDHFKEEYRLKKQDRKNLKDKKVSDRFEKISYAKIECDLPLCANGVQLIDSPGLGEHASRTKTTTNFLHQSQAVIFVLSATHLFSEVEQEAIKNLGSGRLNHVFFVVNRINLIDQDDIEEVEEAVQEDLKPHFLDKEKQFDQAFYDRRVFFINALSALEARCADPIEEIQLEDSRLPALERSLEQFLTGEEKVAAELQSSVQVLTDVVKKACQKIKIDKTAFDQELVDLEKRLPKAKKKLKDLEREKKQIERTISRCSERIANRIHIDLINYVNQLPDTWPRDSEKLIRLDKVSLSLITKAATHSRPAKRQITEIIENQTQHYLRVKLTEWSDRIPALVQQDIDQMEEELGNQIGRFNVRLEQVNTFFTTGKTRETINKKMEQEKGAKQLQALLAIVSLDMSQAAGSVLGEGDWSSFFKRLVQQIVLVGGLDLLLSGGMLFISVALVEFVLTTRTFDSFRQQMRKEMGKKLHENLRKEVGKKKMQNEISKKVSNQFEQLAQEITSALQSQIDELRASQERIISQMGNKSFSVKKEKKRLNAIDRTLQQLVKSVS